MNSLIAKKHKLNGSVLSLRQYYPFLEKVTETTTRMVKINPRLLNHVVKNCEKEVLDRFGAEVLTILKENEEELPSETANEIEEFMAKFTVQKLTTDAKLEESDKEELKDMVKMPKVTVTFVKYEGKQQIELFGRKADVVNVHGVLQSKIVEIEKKLNIVNEEIKGVAKIKYDLLLLHAAIEKLKKDYNVDIEPGKDIITLEGTGRQVPMAKMEMLEKFAQITEDNIDLQKNEKRFLEEGGLSIINNSLKKIKLKGMVSFSQTKDNKAKILVFDSAKVEDVISHLKSSMYQKEYFLDEDSRTLLNGNKWEEFYASLTTGTSVRIFKNQKATEISLIGKKSEVQKCYNDVENFIKHNTIVKESADLEKEYLEYLAKYCEDNIRTIEKDLREHFVRVNFVEGGEAVVINGTKKGVKQAKKQLHDIVSAIAKDKIRFDKPTSQKYLKSDEGKILIEGIESKNKCLIRPAENSGSISSITRSIRFKPQSCLSQTPKNREREDPTDDVSRKRESHFIFTKKSIKISVVVGDLSTFGEV